MTDRAAYPKGINWTLALIAIRAAGFDARYVESDDPMAEDDELILTKAGADLPVTIQCPNMMTPMGCAGYSVSHTTGEGEGLRIWHGAQVRSIGVAAEQAVAKAREEGL